MHYPMAGSLDLIHIETPGSLLNDEYWQSWLVLPRSFYLQHAKLSLPLACRDRYCACRYHRASTKE
jgi:hypothetical protein